MTSSTEEHNAAEVGKRGKNKLKLLYLKEILETETDAEHGLTMNQLIERLQEYGIGAERKSISSDIKVLQDAGVNVVMRRGAAPTYAIERRGFTLSQLMLMVDAIESCRAITERQSKLLIANIKTLASTYEQEKLDREIHVVGRVKSENENIFENVDLVHEAMRLGCRVEFAYARRCADGTRREEHGGQTRTVTPLRVTYAEGFYYLTAWDDSYEGIREFRLDRMVRVTVRGDLQATANEAIDDYRNSEHFRPFVFGRFSGTSTLATLSVHPDKVEIITDRFGDEATFLTREGSDEVLVSVRISKSQQFFGWVAGLDKAVRIVAPESLAAEYKAYVRSLLEDD